MINTYSSFTISQFSYYLEKLMAFKAKSWLILHLLLLLAYFMQHCVYGEFTQVPCLFIFGDSLSDSGNNNNLQTHAKPNYKPYGIDFLKGRPTGRFTNGRTSIDIIGNIIYTIKSIILISIYLYVYQFLLL